MKNLMLFIGEVRRGAKDCWIAVSDSLSLSSLFVTFLLRVCVSVGAEHFLLLIQNE